MKIDKSCKKCGYSDTNLVFFEIGEYNPGLSSYHSFLRERGLLDDDSSLTENVVVCTCRTCGYVWVEVPIDERETEVSFQALPTDWRYSEEEATCWFN